MYSSLVLDVFGVYSGVFGCILALPLRYEETTHLNIYIYIYIYIYIPNVSKALAIKGQKDEGGQNGKPG